MLGVASPGINLSGALSANGEKKKKAKQRLSTGANKSLLETYSREICNVRQANQRAETTQMSTKGETET